MSKVSDEGCAQRRFILFLLGVTDFKAVKGSSSAEERSAAYQPGLLLLLAGAAAVTILFAAVTCVAVTLRRQASFKPI